MKLINLKLLDKELNEKKIITVMHAPLALV